MTRRIGTENKRRRMGAGKPSIGRGMLAFAVLLCLLAGCSPRLDENTLSTQIAGGIYASLTAAVPTLTSTPEYTPTPDYTPTLTPYYTPTPLPQARIHSGGLNLRAGPGPEFPVIETLTRGNYLLVVGQYRECAWLKVIAPDGQKGWVTGDPVYVVLEGDCELIPHGVFQPLNGSLVYDVRQVQGSGSLTIINGTAQDAVVVMNDMSGSPTLAVYLRAASQADVTGILETSYEVYYMGGSNWDGDLRTFLTPDQVKHFTNPLNFRSSSASTASLSITLGSSLGGAQTQTEDVPLDDFPVLR